MNGNNLDSIIDRETVIFLLYPIMRASPLNQPVQINTGLVFVHESAKSNCAMFWFRIKYLSLPSSSVGWTVEWEALYSTRFWFQAPPPPSNPRLCIALLLMLREMIQLGRNQHLAARSLIHKSCEVAGHSLTNNYVTLDSLLWERLRRPMSTPFREGYQL